MLSSRLGRVGGLAILVGAGAAVVAGGSGIATAEPSDGSATRSHSASAATAAHPRDGSRPSSRPDRPQTSSGAASVPQPRRIAGSVTASAGSRLGRLVELPASWTVLGASARVLGQSRTATRPAAMLSTGQVLDPVASAQAAGAPVAGFLSGLAAVFSNQRPALHPGQTGQGANGVVTGILGATDPDSAVLSYTLTGTPEHGTVSVGTDGSYTYLPDPSTATAGTSDSFRVTVSDAASGVHFHGLAGLINSLTFGLVGQAGHTSITTVAVNVAPFNNLPTGYAVVGDPTQKPVRSVDRLWALTPTATR